MEILPHREGVYFDVLLVPGAALAVVASSRLGDTELIRVSATLTRQTLVELPGRRMLGPVMGPDGAVSIIFRNELKNASDAQARNEELVSEYRETFANPWKAAELGYIDEVIKPEETRPKVINALEMLQNKRDTIPPKKHGNIPL